MDEVNCMITYRLWMVERDGLYFYREITEACRIIWKPGRLAYIEIGCSQGRNVKGRFCGNYKFGYEIRARIWPGWTAWFWGERKLKQEVKCLIN